MSAEVGTVTLITRRLLVQIQPRDYKALDRALLDRGFVASRIRLLTDLLTSSNVERSVRAGMGWHQPVSDGMEQGQAHSRVNTGADHVRSFDLSR